MTRNQNRKVATRAIAAERGISYSAASVEYARQHEGAEPTTDLFLEAKAILEQKLIEMSERMMLNAGLGPVDGATYAIADDGISAVIYRSTDQPCPPLNIFVSAPDRKALPDHDRVIVSVSTWSSLRWVSIPDWALIEADAHPFCEYHDLRIQQRVPRVGALYDVHGAAHLLMPRARVHRFVTDMMAQAHRGLVEADDYEAAGLAYMTGSPDRTPIHTRPIAPRPIIAAELPLEPTLTAAQRLAHSVKDGARLANSEAEALLDAAGLGPVAHARRGLNRPLLTSIMYLSSAAPDSDAVGVDVWVDDGLLPDADSVLVRVAAGGHSIAYVPVDILEAAHAVPSCTCVPGAHNTGWRACKSCGNVLAWSVPRTKVHRLATEVIAGAARGLITRIDYERVGRA